MAAQEMKMLKNLRNGTASPEIGNLNMHILLFSGKLLSYRNMSNRCWWHVDNFS